MTRQQRDRATKRQENTVTRNKTYFSWPSCPPLPLSLSPLLLVIVLVACTTLRAPGFLPGAGRRPEPAEGPPARPTAVVLAQPTPAGLDPFGRRSTRVVEVRIGQVRDLSEVLVQPGDTVEVGSTLAELSGYAAELSGEVQLAEEQLAEAKARLAGAEADLDRAREEAASAREQAMAEAEARVTKLSRELAALQRQKQIAEAKLAQARATTEYRQRWLDILKPLQEFDPWGDLPYLVGAQSGPQGLRSDLAYREALARAGYELRLAELEETIAEVELADAAAELSQAQAELKAAQATLEQLEAAPEPPTPYASLDIYEAAVRIGEIRLALAREKLSETVVRSLVAGKVLEVQVDRVVGNEATVVIRIMAER